MNADQRKYDQGIESREGGWQVGRLLSELGGGFLFALIGYLLGACELPFGAMPFGVAMLCAADRRAPYVFVGVCISALFSAHPLILICSYAAVFIIRILVRLTIDRPAADAEGGAITLYEILPRLFSENVFLRMSNACVGAFIISLYRLVEGGYLIYDLYGSLISMVAAPCAVLLVHGLFNGVGTESRFGYFSAAVLGFGVIYSAREVSIYGVSLAFLGAMAITLYVSRKHGMIFGVVTGSLLGLAASPIFAPAFIFASLAAGACWRISPVFASVAAFSAALAWGLYVDGIGAIIKLMPAILAASLLFVVADKLFLAQRAVGSGEEEKESVDVGENTVTHIECAVAGDELNLLRLGDNEKRIRELSDSFMQMSGFFYELGDRMKMPLAGDIKQICDNAFDACCTNCVSRERCWETNYTDTLGAIATISARVHKEGRISASDVPAELREVCERLSDITDEINHNCTRHMKQLMLCDKTEIFALDYEAISELLEGNFSDGDGEFSADFELTERLCKAFSESNIGIGAAIAYGKNKKRVILRAPDVSLFDEKKDEIISLASEVCGLALEVSESDEGEKKNILMLKERPRFKTSCAMRSRRAEDEESFCGDTLNVFEVGEDKLYSVISDGMGSGRDAALTSGICGMFLGKMLSAANSCEITLKMLNGFLRNKGGGSMHECSATVDLLELDRINGRASFYKSGAAPTYVFREGSLFKLRSKTVPVGIIRELDTRHISFEVGAGDVIVMISDGVTGGKDECPWLFDMLKRNVRDESLERCADLIVERAARENGGDDISVVIIKVEENKE